MVKHVRYCKNIQLNYIHIVWNPNSKVKKCVGEFSVKCNSSFYYMKLFFKIKYSDLIPRCRLSILCNKL